jgi:YHS domain-containing protein
MKPFIILIFIVGVFATVGCNSAGSKQTEFDSLPADAMNKNEYPNITFASKKDTVCGMPLSAGVGDTLQWNGKVYGFCSKKCKDMFIERLKKESKL